VVDILSKFESYKTTMMKSKISFVLISLFLYLQTGTAQTISLTFSGLNNGKPIHLEKIEIGNIDKSCDTTLYYPDSILVLHSLGIDDPAGNPDRLTLFQNTPNPVTDRTFIKVFNPASGDLFVVVREIGGKPVCAYEAKLDRGYHLFEFSPGKAGIFIFSVSTDESTASKKVVSGVTSGNGTSGLRYSGKSGHDNDLKAAISSGFVFSTGDQLRYTGHYLTVTSTLVDTPQNDKTYTFEFTGPGFTCGQNLTIIHSAYGGVAPVNKTTTYGTVTNIPGDPSKCWITSNLGSDHQATAVDDSTEASAGWYWQFNRKQGYLHDGLIRTPNTLWISNILDNSDWLITNDPCNLELGAIWRIPTITEWRNVNETGGWTTWTGAWNSVLKLHAAGELRGENGNLSARGVQGFYWCNLERDNGSSWGFFFRNDYSDMNVNTKPYGCNIRCLRDTCSTLPAMPAAGAHVSSPTQIIWNWEPIPGATGYKWSDSKDFYFATDMGSMTSKTETGLNCYSSYTRYVWAYNACNNYSMPLTLTAATSPCP
jgi:hypothetical protein